MTEEAPLRGTDLEKTRMAALRAALDEGEASGPAQAFDFDEFLASKRRKQDGRQ